METPSSRKHWAHTCFVACLFTLLLSLLFFVQETSADWEEPSASSSFCFDPVNPGSHPVWKGRMRLPYRTLRTHLVAITTYLGVPPENASRFLLEIAACESDFGYYVRQVKGPAQSVWQIEPATARDLHERLPGRDRVLYEKIVALRDPSVNEEENIVTNLNYGAALCVGILVLKGIRFETLSTLPARALAWKKHYNTYLGKGTLEGYCQKAMKYTGAVLAEDASFAEAFDRKLLLGANDIFAARDRERYLLLPDNFDESEVGRHYLTLLRENPRVFEEVPDSVLRSRNVRVLAKALTLELVGKVQRDPTLIRDYLGMPDAILHPLVRAAMHENALKAYPLLTQRLKNDEEVRRIYEAQLLMQNLMQKTGQKALQRE